MEVKPYQIVAAGIAAFFLIVGANLLSQYQSNESFREKLSGIDFSSIRKQRVAEELMEPVTTETDDED